MLRQSDEKKSRQQNLGHKNQGSTTQGWIDDDEQPDQKRELIKEF
jgi:hypothetical protein